MSNLSGNYEEVDGMENRGRKSLKISHGHNKDHRENLKQLLWTLTVSADHSVPMHYMAMVVNSSQPCLQQDRKAHGFMNTPRITT